MSLDTNIDTSVDTVRNAGPKAGVSRRISAVLEFLREIRSPRWGVVGQGVRFLISGSVVGPFYIGVTTLLHQVLALPFQLALALGYALGVGVHYSMQRFFVWRHEAEFALRTRGQLTRYLVVVVVQYTLTALSTASLPSLLGAPVELVYVVVVVTLAMVNFVVFRTHVFHAQPNGVTS